MRRNDEANMIELLSSDIRRDVRAVCERFDAALGTELQTRVLLHCQRFLLARLRLWKLCYASALGILTRDRNATIVTGIALEKLQVAEKVTRVTKPAERVPHE